MANSNNSSLQAINNINSSWKIIKRKAGNL